MFAKTEHRGMYDFWYFDKRGLFSPPYVSGADADHPGVTEEKPPRFTFRCPLPPFADECQWPHNACKSMSMWQSDTSLACGLDTRNKCPLYWTRWFFYWTPVCCLRRMFGWWWSFFILCQCFIVVTYLGELCMFFLYLLYVVTAMITILIKLFRLTSL